MAQLPQVALVGRMNVGKSTLFNRLSHNVKSVTHNYAGITRDVVKDVVEWQDRTFNLVDTGGLTAYASDDMSEIEQAVQQRARHALHNAQIIVMVVDGKAGILPEDESLAQQMRKYNVPIIVAVNKGDTKEAQEQQYEFYQLPHDAVALVSAQHGTGIDTLLEYIISYLPARGYEQKEPEYRVSFLGRPNVGKSTLLNTIVREERMITSAQPGTTREALSESISFYKQNIQLTDTPGVRRPGSVDDSVEPLMVKQALQAVKETDIVVLLLDASQAGIVHQELKLASYAFEKQHKALIMLLNKYDLVDDETREQLDRNFDFYEHMLRKLPMLRISCETGKNTGKVVPLINTIWQRHNTEFSQEELEELFIKQTQKKPIVRSEQRLYVLGAEQVGTAPITIALYVNKPYLCEESEMNFFENLMRKRYELTGVPVRFVIYKH